VLLEGADLRLVRGRRYGLVGRNGVGKTTLLKHMANFDIEGFPRHHRVLHVKQEVRSSNQSVLEVVLDADVERRQLLAREAEILRLQEEASNPHSNDVCSASASAIGEAAADAKTLAALSDELQAVYARMEAIGCATAEARAASILSGLRFTEAMQKCPTDSLSGGWRMRVALAGALFIEPDLLMLDEPTNHLDLEAVLWLEDYLQTYPHTVLLVSHDRAFLNEVCTDVVLFKDLKLTYYRGNYDTFESTRREQQLVQQRQHEAQMVKVRERLCFMICFCSLALRFVGW
jgi:ATP-binding cassette subfamily F protein 3